MVQWLELCDGSISDQGVKILYTVSQPKKLKQTKKQQNSVTVQSLLFFFQKILNFGYSKVKYSLLKSN